MARSLLSPLPRALGCLLVAGCLGWLSTVPASGQNPITSPPSATPAPAEPEKSERGPPALPWAAAAVFTIITLLIVCMPSRKA